MPNWGKSRDCLWELDAQPRCDTRRGPQAHGPKRFRLARIEPLESRHLLSAIAVGGVPVVSSTPIPGAALILVAQPETPSLVVTTAEDVVDPSDGLTSLREAIGYANAHAGDDTITFAADLAGQTISLVAGELRLADTTGTTTIVGLGTNSLTIDANYSSRVFYVAGGATADISGLTITRGCSVDGAGIKNDGTLTLTNTTFFRNYLPTTFLGLDARGGGVANHGTATIVGCEFTENCSIIGGGIANYGQLTIDSSVFSSNSALHGGGIANQGALTITNSTLCGNGTSFQGGGIENRGTLTIVASTLSDNYSWNEGGGIENYGSLTVIDSTLSRNGAFLEGGGIENHGAFTLANVTFSGNYLTAGEGDADIADHPQSPIIDPLPDPVDPSPIGVANPDNSFAQLVVLSDYFGSTHAVAAQFGLERVASATVDVGVSASRGFAPAVLASNQQAAQASTPMNDPTVGAIVGSAPEPAAIDRLFGSVGSDSFWLPSSNSGISVWQEGVIGNERSGTGASG